MPAKKSVNRAKKRVAEATRKATRAVRRGAKDATRSLKRAVRTGGKTATSTRKKAASVGKAMKKTVRRTTKKATRTLKKAKGRAMKTARRTAAKAKKAAARRKGGSRRSSKPSLPTGIALLHDERLNKGTAYSEEERDVLKLRGLLPARLNTLAEQQDRVLENYRHKTPDLEKYIFLIGLQDRNETLFYRTLIDNIHDMTPIVYTPTVGEACAKFGHIFRRPRGLFVTAQDRGRIKSVLRNWPESDVSIIVVTDGERILGLGDLGAHGMGIPIGKLSLYTACAGVHPRHALPITLDVGTNNAELLRDPLYIGLQQRRLRGAEYDAFIDEFITAVRQVFPRALIQFEDFATQNAFRLLQKYRHRICTFNDDIQGTAAVTLASLLGACRITGHDVTQQRLVFLGAGEAGIGIADLITSAMVREGMSQEEARDRMWFVDSKGLVARSRTDLAAHKLPYARDHAFLPDLAAVVDAAKPTGLIGVSGKPQTFTEPIVRRMAELNERPIVFALSNPTAMAECTAEQVYSWSGGRAVYASGSPFDPVTVGGKRHVPTQGNNAYIFPGVGLGVILSGAKRVTDEMFYAAARAVAGMTTQSMLDQGSVLPPLTQIREVSATIAAAVATLAWDERLAAKPRPDDVLDYVRRHMYDPHYESMI